jgi:hypothetical protein
MADQSLPEIVREEKTKEDSVFLRTVLKRETYNRLQAFAKQYATGQGHWDFGVAIQVLLDNFENNRKALQDDKLNYIISVLEQPIQEQETPKQEEYIEMLGGKRIKKGE